MIEVSNIISDESDDKEMESIGFVNTIKDKNRQKIIKLMKIITVGILLFIIPMILIVFSYKNKNDLN